MIPEGSLRLLGNEGRLARDPAFLWGPVGSGRGSWAISVGGCEGEEGRGAGAGDGRRGCARACVCVHGPVELVYGPGELVLCGPGKVLFGPGELV